MNQRYLLFSSVDRLPTINELQESDAEDGDLDGDPEVSAHNLEEYLASIRELSQPAPYPLHGPLRGHRRWTPPCCRRRVQPASLSAFLISNRSSAPWTAIDPADVSLTFADPSNCDKSERFKRNLLELLAPQSLFAGLV